MRQFLKARFLKALPSLSITTNTSTARNNVNTDIGKLAYPEKQLSRLKMTAFGSSNYIFQNQQELLKNHTY